MKKKIKIAIDIMGGDNAQKTTIDAVVFASKKITNIEFILFGTKEVEFEIKHKLDGKKIEYSFVLCEDVVPADEKPTTALMKRKESTMALAIKAVRDNIADACVSAGNTGALMAMSKVYLRPLDFVNRPALCTIIPTIKGKSIMLDMGADLEGTKESFYEFALLGSCFIKSLYEIQNPTIAILNIGSEPEKGTQLVKDSYIHFSETFNKETFVGYIEGNEISTGKANVIVTDGFTGNVAIKVYEGAGKMIKCVLQDIFKSSIITRISYLMIRKIFQEKTQKINPNKFNGAMMLGLSKICVKSHGSATPEGFANAIEVAHTLVQNDIISQISKAFETK